MSTATHARMRNSKRARELERAAHKRRSQRYFVGGVLALVALLVVAILATRTGDDDVSTIDQTRPVSVAGEALPPLADNDTAVGAAMPEVSGESFEGASVAIESDGTPKMIIFLAHWCPHCQAEVPVIQSWLEAEGMPAGVDVVSVATATDPAQPNYPPSEWLEREGWTVPVLVDDAASSAGAAFGVNSYPFFAFVDGDGNIEHRVSGELSIDQIEAILSDL